MYVWSGDKCEEWTGNNVQCEPIELPEIVNFAYFSNRGMIHFFPTNLNPSSTSNFLMCTLRKHEIGVAIMLVGNMLHEKCHFAAISSWNPCFDDVTHQ